MENEAWSKRSLISHEVSRLSACLATIHVRRSTITCDLEKYFGTLKHTIKNTIQLEIFQYSVNFSKLRAFFPGSDFSCWRSILSFHGMQLFFYFTQIEIHQICKDFSQKFDYKSCYDCKNLFSLSGLPIMGHNLWWKKLMVNSNSQRWLFFL